MARTRESLLRQYHQGARTLFGSDEETRRAHLARVTGHRSARDCTPEDLASVVTDLRKAGAYDGAARGGQAEDRPTSAQWAALARLARERGWRKGLEDQRLQDFCCRTAKVDSTRFLTRTAISACITGLSRWDAQAAARVGEQA